MKFLKLFFFVTTLVSFSLSFGQTIDRTITSNTDDAEELASNGDMDLNSSDLDLGSKRVGLRFTNITIPQGATITNAYLQFTADENETGNVSLRIRGNDVDNASTYTSSTGDVFTNRAKTDAYVIWTPGNWTQGNSGSAQRTPDISSVVQEIINRGGWNSGNSIAFMITSTIGYDGAHERASESHEGDPSPAQLHIEYTTTLSLNRSITSNTDDAEELASNGDMDLNSSDLDLGSKRVGLRFTNITIPQGATITNAYLQFTADENETGNVSLRIRGNDVDNASTYTSSTGDVFTNRAKTDAYVIWTPGNWTQGNSGSAQRTPDISSVVQEIINRGGWSSGNSIAFMITSTIGYDGAHERASESHEGDPSPAQLHIEYDNAVQYTLSTNTNGSGSISISPGGGTYNAGTSVTLTATANSGWHFDHWSGDLSGSTNPSTVLMDANKNITANFAQIQTVERLVSTAEDDVEEGENGGVFLNSSDLEFVYDSFDNRGNQTVGIRITNLNIPQGATITNAYIQFVADETSSGTANITIRGNDVDDASPFIVANHNISNRTMTTASVNWMPPAWNTVGEAGVAQRTSDISSIVQEIVNRPNWTPYNAMAFIFTGTGTRTAEAYNSGANLACKLHVEYTSGTSSSTATISNGSLSISFHNLGNGIELTSIKRDGTELLNTSASKSFFTMDVNGSTLTSTSGWTSTGLSSSATSCTLTFTGNGVNATASISMDGDNSNWDMFVDVDNTHTINDVIYPIININAGGNDHFLTPHFSGQVFDNPVASNLNSDLIYPRGSNATMQFSAYYNNNYGIYFATHDPTASFKQIISKVVSGGVEYSNDFSIPDKTVNGNDWNMPGYFALDLFEGNWYDAAQIYRSWVSSEASYWPQDTQARQTRQAEIGKIGAWAYISGEKNAQTIKSLAETFHNDFGVPVGFHWYDWTQAITGDEKYPHYFPEISGMKQVVSDLQSNDDIFPMPYMNARLYDTALDDYQSNGLPYATKDENGTVNTQSFDGNTFAVMCPTQSNWQNTLINVQAQLTGSGANDIGANVTYLDQLCHAKPVECMDASHGHPLGYGSLWRDGYKQMLSNMHNSTPANVFYVAEGAADFLNDEVDGLYTLAWIANGLVPAYTAVYSGKVQIFGIDFGSSSYDQPVFYSKFAQTFNFGIQPGGLSLWLSSDNSSEAIASRNYLREIATLRYKLREFMSFGRMLKPLLDVSGRPTITTDWKRGSGVVMVTSSILQQSIWKNKDDDKLLIVFSNASKTETLNNVNIDILGSDYGLSGDLRVQRIREGNDDNPVTEPNHFVRTISLAPKEVYAIVVESSLAKKSVKKESKLIYKLEQNYPNPFNPTTVINFTIPNTGNTKVEVFNMLGQKVTTLVNKNLEAGSHKVEFNARSLSSGIYIYKLQSGNFTATKKMLLLK